MYSSSLQLTTAMAMIVATMTPTMMMMTSPLILLNPKKIQVIGKLMMMMNLLQVHPLLMRSMITTKMMMIYSKTMAMTRALMIKIMKTPGRKTQSLIVHQLLQQSTTKLILTVMSPKTCECQ